MRHLRIYRAIRLIGRMGSIRRAADRLSVSHSALNRALLAFEAELGVDLFDRVAGGVRLSTAGEHLMGLIDSHLNAFDDFQALVTDMQGGPVGALRLSLASELATGLLPEAIAAFQAEAPRVALEVMVADDAARLYAHEVDLAILTRPGHDGRADVLLSHQTALIARTGGAPLGRASDLQDYQLVLPPEGTGARAVADHILRKNRLTPPSITGFAGLWPVFAGGPQPQAQLLPAASLPSTESHPPAPALGHVQIAMLRRQGVALGRPAQLFLTRMQALLDRSESTAAPPAPQPAEIA